MAQIPGWAEKMRCCLIADRNQCRGDLEATVEAALRGGVRTVHLRQKDATTRNLYDMAASLRTLTRRHDALLIVNDRVDVALAAGADGVHLGWQSMTVPIVRKLMESETAQRDRAPLIGKSVHNPEEARRAVEEGADYLFAGPVYDTPSKAGLVPTLGLSGLREICSEFDVPVVGLGGIHEGNVADVVRVSATGVAVIRAILQADKPEHAARDLLRAASRK